MIQVTPELSLPIAEIFIGMGIALIVFGLTVMIKERRRRNRNNQ